jgi:hypothetical protein
MTCQLLRLYSVSDRWVNDNDRGIPKYSEKNLAQCHFIHYKFHTYWPGIEPGPQQWESDKNCLGHFTAAPTTVNSVTFSLFQVYISTYCSISTQSFGAIKTDTCKCLACTNQQSESTKHNNYPICLQMSLVSKSGPKPRSWSPPKYVTYSREGFKPYWRTKRYQASSHDSFCITVSKTITATVTQCEIHTKPQHYHRPTL